MEGGISGDVYWILLQQWQFFVDIGMQFHYCRDVQPSVEFPYRIAGKFVNYLFSSIWRKKVWRINRLLILSTNLNSFSFQFGKSRTIRQIRQTFPLYVVYGMCSFAYLVLVYFKQLNDLVPAILGNSKTSYSHI